MRKSIVVILVFGFMAASCATYTCPTYAKNPNKVEKKEIVKNENI
jgi:hypothetical protein